jgi:hypothetical protein
VRELDIPVVVLEHERAGSLQDSGAASRESRGVLARSDAMSTRFDPNQPDGRIVDERIEHAHGVTAAADAGDDRVREPSDCFETLGARLAPDDRLELANHERVWMRPEYRSQQVVTVAHGRDPVTHRFVDGVLERSGAGVNPANGCAEQLHAEHVQGLAHHVFCAHVYVALEAEQRAHRRGCHTVLPRPGLRDHPTLAHAHGEECLAQRVVDLVSAGVGEILALQEDPGAAGGLGQTTRFVDRRWSAYVVTQQPREAIRELGILSGVEVGALERGDGCDQRFRHETAAVRAVITARVRIALRKRRG